MCRAFQATPAPPVSGTVTLAEILPRLSSTGASTNRPSCEGGGEVPPRFVLDPAARQFKEGEDAQNGKPLRSKNMIRRARLIFDRLSVPRNKISRPEHQEAGGSDLCFLLVLERRLPRGSWKSPKQSGGFAPGDPRAESRPLERGTWGRNRSCPCFDFRPRWRCSRWSGEA